MRVLLFIEPHPVRDTLTHFRDVAKNFLPLLSSARGFDIRLFANNTTLNHLRTTATIPDEKRVLRPTEAEEEQFQEFLGVPWETDGLSVWLDLMAGKGEVTVRQYDLLQRLWNIFPFEMIVHWGENGAITRFIEKYPTITRIAMELGCTRPPFFDSVVTDPFGTNGSGVVPKLLMSDLRDAVGNTPMSREEALLGYSNEISAPAYAQQFLPLPELHGSQWGTEKTAFLPLQLFDDANLQRFSPYDTISDVVLDVVPKLADAGYMTVVKPHPASKHRKGSQLANVIARRELRPWADRVIWCDESMPVPNARLFALSDLVITVNSSVGFEALYFDKTVVVLGDAVYKPKDMFPSLEDVLSGNFDRAAFLDSAGILRRFMLGGYLHPNTLFGDISGFCHRISLIHHLIHQAGGEPAAFAKGLWQATSPSQMALAKSSMTKGISVPGDREYSTPLLGAPSTVAPLEQEGSLTNSTLVFQNIAAQIKRYWLCTKTLEWLETRWATKTGQREVIAVGGINEGKEFLRPNRDEKRGSLAPLQNYGFKTFTRSRASEAEASFADDVFTQLKRCADIAIGVGENTTAEYSSETSTSRYASAFQRLMTHVSGNAVDSFVDWLDVMCHHHSTLAEIIKIGQVVDVDYYLESNPDVANAGMDPVAHFISSGMSEKRSPRRGIGPISPDALASAIRLAAAEAESGRGFPVHPLSNEEEDRRGAQITKIRKALEKSQNKIAVVAHLYYTDLVQPLVDRLAAIEEPFDLFVTMPDWGTRRIVEMVQASVPDAVFYETSNRGRDIGPFLDLVPIILDRDYDILLKVQTKRGYFRAGRMIESFGTIWREEALNALLGSSERVAEIIDAFRNTPSLNMVGPEPYLLTLEQYAYHDGGALCDRLLETDGASDGAFYAGTMFWVRPAMLERFAPLSLTSFPPESGANEGALAHLVERLFGQVAGVGDGILASAPVDPRRPLDLTPEPMTATLDAYFTKRQAEFRSGRDSTTKGALFW